MDDLPYIVIIIICIIFSAFFSASETAYTSVNKIKLKTQADDGDKKAQAVLKVIDNYDRLISTILIGNNIVNILSASLATILFVKAFNDNGSWISTIVMTIVVLIFGEVCPKGFAKNHSEGIAKFVNPIIKVIIYIFFPLSWLLEQLSKLVNKIFRKKAEPEAISEDELLTIIDEIEDEGIIKPYEKDLITSAIKFDDIEVKDIVTPRKDIVGISSEDTVHDIINKFEESKYTRLPVYNESKDNIIGILHIKDFYSYILSNKNEKFNIFNVMQKPLFISKDTRISTIFKIFKEKGKHMAIVLDQFDSTLGLITLEDIIEELVGEIFDESDEMEESIKLIGEDEYTMSGNEILEKVFEEIEYEVDDEEMDLNQTVNSFLSEKLGRIPTSGDSYLFNDEWVFKVISANRKGAMEVNLKKIDKED